VARKPEPKKDEVKQAYASSAPPDRPAKAAAGPKVNPQPATRNPQPNRRPPVPSIRYDGTGRYTMAKDDGAKGTQGLAELARRFGAKPYEQLLAPDRTWQTERVIFRDLETGATVVRLTNDPWANELSYFGKNWSADGKYVVFRRRPGEWESSTATHGPMALNSDGTGLRNVFRDYRYVHCEVCSPAEPNVCFGVADDKQVVAFDLRTGKADHVVRDGLQGSWHMKVSPDGKYLLGRGNISKGGRGLWVARSDGKELHEVPVPEGIHDSYQFHPSQRKIMYWYEGRFNEGFVQCDFDGAERTKVPLKFDWNHGDVGPDRGVHTHGHITRVRGDGWAPLEYLFHAPGVEYYDDPYRNNGYVSWSPKDQPWAYATRLVQPPYLSEIQAFHAEPVPGDVVNRYRVCTTGLRSTADLDHPGASPDGTKVLFNALPFGRIDIFYVVARLPERPLAVRAERSGGSVRLTWRAPAHHAEIAGYHVYRSGESGINYVPLTPRPVQGTEFTDDTARPGETAFYAITAVEHSGLESGLSEEVSAGEGGAAPRRLYVEAEQGERNRLMWVALDGRASDLHYVWMRGREGEGRVTLPVKVPEAGGPWSVWGRVKGENGVSFRASAGGGPVTLQAPPSPEWAWVKFDGTLSGSGPLVLTSSLYGSAVDSVVLSSDPDFSPARAARVRWPKLGPVQGVSVNAVSPYAVRLSWPAVAGDTFHHYNLYCGRQADFPVGQGTLVASPDRGSFLDWGLQPGAAYYYRVTCVDRAGNESPPSAAVRVSTPAVEHVVIEKSAAPTVAFRVPRKGLYVLWLKLKKGPGGGQYMDILIDGKKRASWTIVYGNLDEESWFSYGRWGQFELGPGDHTLTISNGTKHTVQRVLWTTDLSQRPEGRVNMLHGW
jgi:fibronectin type 3 domain-containing protein